jgi:hypothetical protein
LRATRRSSPASSAEYTEPIDPEPSSDSIRYPASENPDRSSAMGERSYRPGRLSIGQVTQARRLRSRPLAGTGGDQAGELDGAPQRGAVAEVLAAEAGLRIAD